MLQYIFVILVVVGIILFIKEKIENIGENPEPFQKKNQTFNPSNYEPRPTLMTPTERLFFETLRRAVGDKYDIYPQVNLDKIFKVKFLNSRFAFNSAKSSIDRKSVDFLITIRDTQRPYIAIEIDDSSHFRQDRIIRDSKVESLFNFNGIRLMRFNAFDKYTEQELKKIFS